MVEAEKKYFDLGLKSLCTVVTDSHNLILRHFILPFLFNNIIAVIGTLDFKSRKELIKGIQKNSEINKQLKKIDEAYKILFAYFKIEKNTFLSYLISRWRLIANNLRN